MTKSLAKLLNEMVSSYYDSGISMPLKDYMILPKHINQMTKCCKDHDINILSEKIKQFIIDLFTKDPNGCSCINTQKPTTLQPSGYPYPLKVTDYNRPKTNYNLPFSNKPKYMAQPQCPNNDCEKQAYFGLPFCPHCMKQIPPFIPKKKDSMQANVSPVMDLTDLFVKPVKEKVTAMIAGVKKTFDLDDVIVKDKDFVVTYRDVEKEKNIKKHIPKR